MFTKTFINSIIDSHGGLDLYSQTSSIEVQFTFTGATLSLKQRPYTHLTPHASVSTKEQKVTYHGLGGPQDEAWIFTPSKVYKQSSSTGAILESRDNPREAFAGHTMETPWDDLHFLYFAGYALWQYINFPFFLAREDIYVEELPPHQEHGETWRVLEVKFPEQERFASHNSTQRYYFDEGLELVRHDYAPDVLAGAWAAHYTVDHVGVGAGMRFPTVRRVVALGREGRPMLNGPVPTLINLVFTGIEVKGGVGVDGAEGVWALSRAPAP